MGSKVTRREYVLPSAVSMATLLEQEAALNAERGTTVAVRDAAPLVAKRIPELRRYIEEHAATRSAAILSELLTRAAEVGSYLPTPEQWAAFYSKEVLPTLNQLATDVSFCAECGAGFDRRKGKRHCKPGCASAQRNRGRNAVSAKLRRHVAKCARCRQQRPCSTVDAMIEPKARSTDALSRFRGKMPGEREA
jgi:hypothetical protein